MTQGGISFGRQRLRLLHLPCCLTSIKDGPLENWPQDRCYQARPAGSRSDASRRSIQACAWEANKPSRKEPKYEEFYLLRPNS